MIKDPAFPYCVWIGDHHQGHLGGISKREYFAAKALSNSQIMNLVGFSDKDCEAIARRAFRIADAMLAHSEKGDPAQSVKDQAEPPR